MRAKSQLEGCVLVEVHKVKFFECRSLNRGLNSLGSLLDMEIRMQESFEGSTFRGHFYVRHLTEHLALLWMLQRTNVTQYIGFWNESLFFVRVTASGPLSRVVLCV